MRPIDADAFNEKYGNYYAEEEPEEGFIGTVGQLIDNAPTVEERPKGKWIPVTERLPEDDEDVLVTRVYTGSTYSFIDMVWFNKGKFLTQDGELELSNVVAWMPLPEPYKRGEENG